MERIRIGNHTISSGGLEVIYDNTSLILADKINEIIDTYTTTETVVVQNDDRLKTLEDKVKFIMENTKATPDFDGGKITDISLQDLWDEEKAKQQADYNIMLLKSKGEPTVKECPYGNEGCHCNNPSAKRYIKIPKDFYKKLKLKSEPTDNSDKIEEIISGCKDKYVAGYFSGPTYFKIFESWLRDKLKSLI